MSAEVSRMAGLEAGGLVNLVLTGGKLSPMDALQLGKAGRAESGNTTAHASRIIISLSLSLSRGLSLKRLVESLECCSRWARACARPEAARQVGGQGRGSRMASYVRCQRSRASIECPHKEGTCTKQKPPTLGLSTPIREEF